MIVKLMPHLEPIHTKNRNPLTRGINFKSTISNRFRKVISRDKVDFQYVDHNDAILTQSHSSFQGWLFKNKPDREPFDLDKEIERLINLKLLVE